VWSVRSARSDSRRCKGRRAGDEVRLCTIARMVVPYASRVASLGMLLPLAACSFDSPRGGLDPSTDDPGMDPGEVQSVVPSNGLGTSALTDGDAELDTAATGLLELDTDSGAIRRTGGDLFRAPGEGYDQTSKIFFRVVAQTGAPSIGMFSFASLRVAASGGIRARGKNALALAAEGMIAIDGLLDLTGGAGACPGTVGGIDQMQCAGPGGNRGGLHGAAAMGPGAGGAGTGGPSGYAESGGGGGGHLTAGGSGGLGLSTTRGAAGAAFGRESLEPLVGGGGGGGGADEPQTGAVGAAGGGGGGAVQIVSATQIRIGPSTGAGTDCGINAGGGGAGRSNNSSAGGGGGGGGGILLEAPEVALGTGCWLGANGGGGSGAHFAAPGTTGRLSAVAAAGSTEGSNGTRSSGDGGAGGALDAAQPGEDGTDEAGGGGGGGGVMRVNTLDARRFSRGGMICPSVSEGSVRLE
jgi:hypothetical protein